MLSKINKMLRQQEGFTLMELMIVVVILGILMAIAIPVYQGVQDRAREKVGDANAAMLNRGVRTLAALGNLDEDEDEPTPYANTSTDWDRLSDFLDLEDKDVQYVVWDETDKVFKFGLTGVAPGASTGDQSNP